MKKLLSLLVAMFVLTGIATASPKSTQPENGYITVSANASEEIVPNIVRVVFYVETEDKNQNVASDLNKKITVNVLETIKRNIDEKTDTIKTLNYSVTPNYNYSNGKRIFDKYIALNTIEVKTENPKNISFLIDETLKAGATRVSGLSYTLDYDSYDYSKLINNAVQIAKNRAKATASALGVKIVGIKNVTTACDSDNTGRYLYMNAKVANADGVSSSYTEEGLVKVSVSVNIEFWVK